MIKSYQHNIPKLYLIKLSKWFMLIMPIVALFYQDNGLDDSSIYLLQAVYSCSVALLEIPSRYMADVIGRKKSIVIGAFLGTLGFSLYSCSASLNQFMLAEIILGFGGSFISGSDSALLFDSLAADKKEQRYLQYEGRITSLGNFAETIAAVGGGLLAAYLGYRSVYFAQTLIASIAIPAALLLTEPPRRKISSRPSFKQILAISHNSIFVNKELRGAIIFSSIIGTATLCMAWTAQVYFIHADLDEKQITPLWVLLNLAAAVVAAYASHVRNYIGIRLSNLIIVFLIPFGYIFLGFLPFLASLLSLFIFYLIRGYATPVLKDMINQNCSSDIRATVLSIRSMIIRVCFSIIGPSIAYISNITTLGTALIIVGIIFLVLSTSSYFFLFAINSVKK